MTRVKETIARHDKGYNCAQSVACTYADLVGLDEATMFKVTEGLGKGMGGTLATCGALSGACVLAGMNAARVIWKHRTASWKPTSWRKKS